MLQSFYAVQRRVGLNCNQPHVAIVFAQTPSRSNERAAGSDSSHKMCDASFGLSNDLGSGGVIVRAPIRRVVVLVCIEVTGRIGGQNTARLGDRPIRPLHGIGEHQLRAVGLQQSLPLGVGVRGNAKSHPVAAGCADHGIRDPSVPGSGIEDHLPVMELAAPLSFIEDADGRRYWIYREGLIGDGRGGLPAWFIHGLFG